MIAKSKLWMDSVSVFLITKTKLGFVAIDLAIYFTSHLNKCGREVLSISLPSNHFHKVIVVCVFRHSDCIFLRGN